MPEPVERARREGAAADWQASAYCRGFGPDAFYPRREKDQRAVALLCHEFCPVREDCLEYALAADERDGVWGGMTEKERKAERKRRAALAAEEAAEGAEGAA